MTVSQLKQTVSGRRNAVALKIIKFLDKQRKDVVFDTEELAAKIKVGATTIKGDRAIRTYKGLASYTTQYHRSKRYWGHPTAIRALKSTGEAQ